MWKCASTSGGATSLPAASITSAASADMPGSMAAMRPFSMAMSA
jgi:hypothetical protein